MYMCVYVYIYIYIYIIKRFAYDMDGACLAAFKSWARSGAAVAVSSIMCQSRCAPWSLERTRTTRTQGAGTKQNYLCLCRRARPTPAFWPRGRSDEFRLASPTVSSSTVKRECPARSPTGEKRALQGLYFRHGAWAMVIG